MDTKDLGCNYGGDWQTVENINEGFPRLYVTSPFALVVEAVHCLVR